MGCKKSWVRIPPPRLNLFRYMKNIFKDKIVLLSISFFCISLFLLSIVYFKNTSFMPLVLHYTGDVGDFLGIRISLVGLIIGFVFLCGLNIILIKVFLKDKRELTIFVKLINLILNAFFLILS